MSHSVALPRVRVRKRRRPPKPPWWKLFVRLAGFNLVFLAVEVGFLLFDGVTLQATLHGGGADVVVADVRRLRRVHQHLHRYWMTRPSDPRPPCSACGRPLGTGLLIDIAPNPPDRVLMMRMSVVQWREFAARYRCPNCAACVPEVTAG
jgi:hypothetical protein